MMMPRIGKTRRYKRARDKARRSEIQTTRNLRREGKRRALDGTMDGPFRSSRVSYE